MTLRLFDENLIRQMGFPKRVIVRNMQEMLSLVNKNLNKSDIYVTLYGYERLKNLWTPDYESAKVDCVFFDFDNGYDDMKLFHKYLLDHDLAHRINFTGNKGFHVFVYCKPIVENKKYKSRAFQMSISAELDIHPDSTCFGDLARLRRLENTFNFKGNKFCIPLDEKQIELPYEEIQELAKKQHNNGIAVIGHTLLDLSSIKVTQVSYSYELSDMPNVDFNLDINLPQIEIPNVLKQILLEKQIRWDRCNGYKTRFLIITWLMSQGYSLEETIVFLRKTLTQGEFNHCVRQEKQPLFLYRRWKEIKFPTVETLLQEGYYVSKDDAKLVNNLYFNQDSLYDYSIKAEMVPSLVSQ